MTKHTTIAAAALASLLFATGAFAQSAQQDASQVTAGFYNGTAPETNGSEGAVQSANGLPAGFFAGTSEANDQAILQAYQTRHDAAAYRMASVTPTHS